MATVKVYIIYLCLFITVLLVENVDGKRGGSSRSSSRTSSRTRSRTSSGGGSYTGARSYSNVALGGRIKYGSSIYTGSTWRVAATAGIIYGGMRYTRLYPHRHEMPPICTNNYEKSPAGRVYGYFICPRDNDTDSYIYCCGAEKREYCCNMEMAQEYMSRHSAKITDISIAAIICIVTAIVVIFIIVIYCCKKRKQAGVIIRRFSKKGHSQETEVSPYTSSVQLPPYSKGGRHLVNENGTQEVPLYGPTPAFDGSVPGIPPPSYNTITAQHPGYGDTNGLPYGSPQPSSYDEKCGLPPPDIEGGPQPYWTPYPPANDTPYPPPSGTPYPHSDGAPYPPPNVAPYPPGDGAPYPPGDGAPYPPGDGAPYPPASGAPYPPASGAPYTSADGAPYPPVDGAPYPPAAGAPYPPADGTPYPYEGVAPYSPSTIASAPVNLESPNSGDGAMTYPPNTFGGKQ